MDSRIVRITEHTASCDALGKLASLESQDQVPFDIKRVYYIYGAREGTIRGAHAHKSLCQFLVCTHGSIEIKLDDGAEKSQVLLNDPTKGILIEPRIWHEMKWLEDDSVLMVLASQHFNESDYIRNYDDFLDYISAHEKRSTP